MSVFSKFGNIVIFVIGSFVTFIFTAFLIFGVMTIFDRLMPTGMIVTAIVTIIYCGLMLGLYWKTSKFLKRIFRQSEIKQEKNG